MDAVERLLGRRWEGVTLGTFLKFDNLQPRVQQHLQRVYATLGAALAVAALGCVLDVYYSIAGLLTYIIAFGCLVALAMTPSIPSTLNKRYGLLAGFAFCQGAGLGKLVGLAVDVDPSLVVTAFLGTTTIFACFSLAALLSARRTYLFLGGWLASAVTCLAVTRLLGGWLAGTRGLAFGAELYGGLLVFSLYVLFDTQLLVEKASAGYTDHVKAALDLLVDLLAIFARVLVVLLRNKAKRQEREERGRDKKRRQE